MVPGAATIGVDLSQEQAELRQASGDYVELTESEHWVQKSSLIGLARILIDGVSGESSSDNGYAGEIEAASADPDQVLKRLSADIGLATSGLEEVTVRAQAFIAATSPETKGLRKDVTAYERALIAAQQSRRSFAEALTIVAERTESGVSDIDAELAIFDAAIDASRDTADKLADIYAGLLEPAPLS